ncbi:histidine kinase [Sphaerisporangium sp. TRM90804]|uniref:sensor histidine kinase n=1 Tax=Sphaerisporangium sp. TRM90804 TaxID=3031113 RepID=UPI00244C4612|nr:histidine kinase [Sphaerisporangium sp. TRM90804]MDH2426541.1 histidine kinase [Sphaerisporangium sp. TRM90804]
MSLSELIERSAGEPSDDVRQVRHEERCRLSSDLHDTLGPALAGIRLRLDTAAALLAHEPEARRLVADAAEETVRAVAEMRRLIDDLGPVDLHAGLPGALRRLAARLGDGGRLTITLDVPEGPPPLPPVVESAVYRIAAECLTNTVRHAAASRVTLRLAHEGDVVVLRVTDDGVGLPGVRRQGRGLPSMTRRAREAGGRLEVLSRRDGRQGTEVRAVLPGRVR